MGGGSGINGWSEKVLAEGIRERVGRGCVREGEGKRESGEKRKMARESEKELSVGYPGVSWCHPWWGLIFVELKKVLKNKIKQSSFYLAVLPKNTLRKYTLWRGGGSRWTGNLLAFTIMVIMTGLVGPRALCLLGILESSAAVTKQDQ